MKAPRVSASGTKHITLGQSGCWELLCLADGTLRLGYDEVPHDVASAGDLNRLRSHFRHQGHTQQVAIGHAKQVQDFYSAGQDTLWITLSAR